MAVSRLRTLSLATALIAAAVAHGRPFRVVAFGDSTTAFRKTIQKVYSVRLAEALKTQGIAAEVLNAGISGNTTTDAKARLVTDVLWRGPDLVVVQFGINDSAVDVWKGATKPRVALDAYEKNLRDILATLKQHGIAAVLMTPNPRRWAPHTKARYGKPPYQPDEPRGFNVALDQYVPVVRRLAKELGVPLVDVYRALEDYDAKDGQEVDALMLDGIHPNDKGHAMVAELLGPPVVAAARRFASLAQHGPAAAPRRLVLVDGGEPHKALYFTGKPWRTQKGALVGGGPNRRVFARVRIGEGDFHIRATASLDKLDGTAAAFHIGGSWFGFDGRGKRFYTNGSLFGGGVRHIGPNSPPLADGKPFVFEAVRQAGQTRFLIDGTEILAVRHRGAVMPIGFYPLRATVRITRWSVEGHTEMTPEPLPAGYSIPTIDLARETHRQVVVDREKGQYLGHVTTVLLEDGKTLIAVYPKGHGRGAIVMKRSTDGGLTWSGRLPTPKSWATSLEVPTLYRVVDKAGKKRLILFSGLYPNRMAASEDDGKTWGELEPIGDHGGIVAMADCTRTTDGRYLAWFHDDGRFFTKGGKHTGKFLVYQIESSDGGLTWGAPRVIAQHPTAHLCEPGVVRSPDGKQLAMLFRENSRQHNGFVIFTHDEGRTWTQPRELPGALTGDRHTLRYATDGRLACVFRDTCRQTPTPGDFVAWVGTYDDLVKGTEGQYRVRLGDNTHGGDCGYPGLEVLPDGTFVATTYGHWTKGEKPYIMSFRFTLAELDAKAKLQPQMTDVFTEGVAHDGYPHIRIPAIVATRKGTLLAFAEGRQGGDHSKNDMILKRSTDSGKTWGTVQVLVDEGGDCINNPQPVVLPSGRVLLVYQVFPENIHARAIGKTIQVAEPGLDGPRVQKCTVIHSDDDGVTWSKPRDVTAGTKPPTRAVALASGPGVGIVLRRGQHKGRIVMPFNNTWYQDGGARRFTVYAAWSDDQGETWKFGQPAPEGKTGDGNEVQMVERADSSLLLNSRSFSAKFRKTARSTDGGDTWTPLADAPALIEPRCQGSILRYTDPLDGKKSRILFANPASQKARVNGTIRLSLDEGNTWPVAKTLYAGGYAYSCLVALPDGAIGCLFERDAYKHITFARFTLEWLTDGRDKSE